MKLAMDRIRSLCTRDSFNRGLQYLKEGRVRELRISEGTANATVRGTYDYRVEIDLNHNLKSKCTCPFDFEGYCKHIIATLLYLSNNYEEIVKKSEMEEKRVDSVLHAMDAERLIDFLKKEFLKNETVKNHFMIYATGEVEVGGRSVYDYKEAISRLFNDASRDGYVEYGNEIDFDSFVDLAERYADKKNFVEASKVYQALSEVIAEKMDLVDDSDGYYGERFWEAIEGLSSCINSLGREDKVGYIDYLFRKFIENKPDYFQDHYDEAIRAICTTKEDLEYLRKLLWPRLPSSLPDSKNDWNGYFHSKVLLDMQRFVLDDLASLGDEESRSELYDLLQKYCLQDEEFCLFYSERLEKDGRLDEAIRVAEEGLMMFPAHLTRELKLFLNKHYETLSPEKYRENLKKLFFQEADWSYYEKLKKVSGEQWNSVFQEIVEYFAFRHARNDDYERAILIDIYIRENMLDAALKEVLARNNLRTLSRYYKHLAGKYPRDYFDAYKNLLLPFADARMGRDHYREVASELRKMKTIKGYEKEFKAYVGMLRERYARRPAFLEEMKRL